MGDMGDMDGYGYMKLIISGIINYAMICYTYVCMYSRRVLERGWGKDYVYVNVK